MIYAMRKWACDAVGVLVVMLAALHAWLDYANWQEQQNWRRK